MAILQNIEDIFNILHDGGISAWTGDKNLLTLTVDCQYLAELIDKSFQWFYIELIEIEKIELDPWTNPISKESILLTKIEDIFGAELDILF